MYTIFRSHQGALAISYVISTKKLEFKGARSLNPNLKPNHIQKGQKVYDWQNSLYFSLTIEEISELLLYLEGKIQLKDDKYHKIHVANNINGFLDIMPNQKSPGTYWINMSAGQNNRFSILINIVEMNIIKEMCKKAIQEFTYTEDVERYEKYKQYRQQNNNNDKQYNQNQFNNYDNQNNNPPMSQNQTMELSQTFVPQQIPDNINQLNNQNISTVAPPPPPIQINNQQNSNDNPFFSI